MKTVIIAPKVIVTVAKTTETVRIEREFRSRSRVAGSMRDGTLSTMISLAGREDWLRTCLNPSTCL